MRYIKGFKIGGLQQKIFNLMLIIVLALIATFVAVSFYQQKHLGGIVEDVSIQQQESITDISEETMEAVLKSAMAKTTSLQAYIAGDLFGDVKADVLVLRALVAELFQNEDNLEPYPFYPPDKKYDGMPSAQVMSGAGLDPADSKDLGLVANLTNAMLSIYRNSGKLNSLFVATTDGHQFFVNERSGSYVMDDGSIAEFEPRERPWYKQAVTAGQLIFTGVELDAYTDIPGLVCAAPVYKDGELVAVVGADIFLSSISDFVKSSSAEGEIVFVVSRGGQVLFSPMKEGSLKAEISANAPDIRKLGNEELAIFIGNALNGNTGLQQLNVDGKDYLMTGSPMGTVGWAVISAVEKSVTQQPTVTMLKNYDAINKTAMETYTKSSERSMQTFIASTLVLLLIAIAASLLLARRIVRPIEHMTKRLGSLSGSEDVFEMEKVYKTGDEIEVLAETFESVSKKARDYIHQITAITAEKERIGTELALATRIQADMLPNIFPAFPERKEFDIYATMEPAKEVGGDFYDFFLIDDTHLGMVIADVSGKGVPAALFMMISKIMVKNYALTGMRPAEVLRAVNEQICANNREEMFVTVWFGILDTETGIITAANAGHEYPTVMHPGGKFELLKDKHGFVVGGMEDMDYEDYELVLEPGSKIFVYTDGIAEAMTVDRKLFGTDRIVDALNQNTGADPVEMLDNVRKAVEDFVQDAEQFDDMTMLAMEYKGKPDQ